MVLRGMSGLLLAGSHLSPQVRMKGQLGDLLGDQRLPSAQNLCVSGAPSDSRQGYLISNFKITRLATPPADTCPPLVSGTTPLWPPSFTNTKVTLRVPLPPPIKALWCWLPAVWVGWEAEPWGSPTGELPQ